MALGSSKGKFLYYGHRLIYACMTLCLALAIALTALEMVDNHRQFTNVLPIRFEASRTNKLSILAIYGESNQTLLLAKKPRQYEYTFGTNGSYASSNLNIKGLSDPEEGFTWTNGDVVTFEIPNDVGASAIQIQLYAMPFVSPPVSSQAFRVFGEGIDSGSYSLKADGVAKIELHDPEWENRKILHVELVFKNAVSPRDLQISSDSRKLALALKKIVISTNTYGYLIEDLAIRGLKFKTGEGSVAGVLAVGEKEYQLNFGANEEVLVNSEYLHIAGTTDNGAINAITIWALIYRSIWFEGLLLLSFFVFLRVIFLYLVDVFFSQGLYKFVFLFLMMALALFFLLKINPHYSGDTVALLKHVHLMDQYLQNGRFLNNGLIHFPLSQFVPLYLFVKAGLSDSLIFKVTIAISLFSFLCMLVLFHYVCQNLLKSAPLFYLAAAILLSGYGTWFSIASFNESFAALVIVLSLVTALSRRSPLVVLFCFVLAGITKEVAPPFLFAFLVMSYYEYESLLSFGFVRKLVIPGIGLGLALLVNALFNVFKYGVVYDTQISVSYFQVPSFPLWMNSLAGLVLSPNGGILFFWPAACLLVLLLYGAVFARSKGAGFREVISGGAILLSVSGLFLMLLLGFAKWWSPFGWLAWGPRLIYPYLPALLILLLYHYRSHLESLAIRLIPSADRALLLGVVLVLLSIPHVLAICDFGSVQARFQPLVSNPGYANPDTDPGKFYAGLSERMWKSRSILISAFDLLNNPAIFLKTLYWAAILMGFAALLYFSRFWTGKEHLQRTHLQNDNKSP